MDTFIRLRIKVQHLLAAINALLFHGDHLHEAARKHSDPEASDALRREGDLAFSARKEMWEQRQKSLGAHVQPMADSSIKGNSAPVHVQQQTNRFHLPKGSRDTLIALVMALSLVTNIVLGFVVHDAYKDLQTQKWLHDYDLEQFKSHEFAQLRNDVEVNKLLMAAQCGKPKE